MHPYLITVIVQAAGWDGRPVLPGPQGSKTPTGQTRPTKSGGTTPVMRESSRKVKPWRIQVANAATVALAALDRETRRQFPLDGPLVARLVLTLPRPQSITADRVDAPDRIPDLSKLARSTEDALTGKVWVDDARVIGYDLLWKTYPGRHPEALPAPGAIIRIRRATHTELGHMPGTHAHARYTELLNIWAQARRPRTLWSDLP